MAASAFHAKVQIQFFLKKKLSTEECHKRIIIMLSIKKKCFLFGYFIWLGYKLLFGRLRNANIRFHTPRIYSQVQSRFQPTTASQKNLFRAFPLPAREKALFSPKCQQLIGQLYGNRSGEKQGEEKRKKKIALEVSFELFFFSARRVMEPSPVEKKRRRRKRYLTH